MRSNRTGCTQRRERFFQAVAVMAVATSLFAGAWAQGHAIPPKCRVVSNAEGSTLQVDGRDFMVCGMNWDYVPIGENYNYSLWKQPDDIIEAALAREMPLLKNMGVNVIRQYVGVPPRWVRYIYERYGIYTVVNHPCARYGFTLDGVWIPSVDYSNPRLRAAVKAEVLALVDEFRGTPGMLMWLLGNESNYGLSWSSFEIEALPEGERDLARARYLYSFFGEIIRGIKERDPERPVAIANGDLQYIDLIAEECPELDILGSNVYRGISARDFFQVIKDKLGIPAMFTEFGADAFNAKEMREDQVSQARYLIGQWEEIYLQSSGKGNVGNAIGGFVFQWSDGWWKFGQESRLDIHDTNASWPNAGYPDDYTPGENNMNEEWWGITAKGPPDERGLYELYPRAAYYALQQVFRLDAFAPGTDHQTITAHFRAIDPVSMGLAARGDRAELLSDRLARVRMSGLRAEFETYNTGGTRINTPRDPTADPTSFPAFQGFDQLQSFYADFEARPNDNVMGMVSVNVLGRVPLNPIDEIFYENRGRSRTVESDNGNVFLEDIERVKVYRAGVSWDDRWFTLDGFYRTGHYHWGYEGDFFGLYREANYGENIDIYNAAAPLGVEIGGKKIFNGLKFAIGPELWWGANPGFLVKYGRRLGAVDATGIYQEDLDEQSTATSSSAIPVPPTRKFTIHLAGKRGSFGVEVGGIWSGNTKVGDTFLIAEKADVAYRLLVDRVKDSDTFGIKGRLTFERGRWHWYGQSAYMGIVADGGPTATITYTGWSLKDTGLGNQTNLLTGLAVNLGNYQVSPNFVWQKPLVGPIPGDVQSPGRPRDILNDPFAVRGNRETVGVELMLTHDPTPATWMWMWDNDIREDARLAWSLGYVFRHLPTTQDAAIGILEDGRTPFAFPGAPPPRDLWEVWARIVSRLSPTTRIVAHLFGGTSEPNGDDARLVKRGGGDVRVVWGSMALETFAKFNDWGPYDYHRDGNITFPVQLMGDLSYSLGAPRWFGHPQTRFGVRGLWRSLNDFSGPRYVPESVLDPRDGNEWEVRTYLHFAL